MEIIMENKNYRMEKVSQTRYKIIDKNTNKLALEIEGENLTRKDLEESFNGCKEHCIFL